MRSPLRFLPTVLIAGMLSFAPAPAGVTVDIDSATLNDLLSAVTEQKVDLDVTEGRSLTVLLDRLKVLRLDPTAGERGTGQILTSVRVRVPDLGLDMTVEPRISLNVLRESGRSQIEVRFERLELPLPLLGQFNLAGLLEPTRFPSDNVWVVEGAGGEQNVKSQLAGIEMGRETIRFRFDVAVLGAP